MTGVGGWSCCLLCEEGLTN